MGCTNPDAVNHQLYADVDDGSCEFAGTEACPTDVDGDGATGTPDLLIFLGSFGPPCGD